MRAAAMSPAVSEPPAVSSMTVPGPMPLSASQAQMWYQSQLAPDARMLNEVVEIRKTGALDVDALRRALTEVVARHEALRTTFDLIEGVPHQIICEPTEVDFPISDFSDLETADAVARAVDIVTTDSLQPYDLVNGPLIRPRLIRIAANDHRLFIGLHHLIWDGLTLNRVVFPELVVLYRSYTTGVPSALRRPAASTSTTRSGSSIGCAGLRRPSESNGGVIGYRTSRQLNCRSTTRDPRARRSTAGRYR